MPVSGAGAGAAAGGIAEALASAAAANTAAAEGRRALLALPQSLKVPLAAAQAKLS